MATIIDGKATAEALRVRIAKAVASLKSNHNLTPGLAVVLVGEDPASKVYVANKAKQTVEVGMNSWEHKLPVETSEADLLVLVTKLNTDPSVHGILVQMPLPKHMTASTSSTSAASPRVRTPSSPAPPRAASCWRKPRSAN
jgi:methylenetetrahydrofolate dehydrogenase (NADP+) / methenyltetrahydrofolate cyclohydrolase